MPNYTVQVTPKAHPTVKEIVEAGYIWPTETTTERIVSEEDMQILKAASEKKWFDPLAKKTKNVARFAFANLGKTDEKADTKKVKSLVPAREQNFPKSQNALLSEQNKALTEALSGLTTLVRELTAPARK